MQTSTVILDPVRLFILSHHSQLQSGPLLSTQRQGIMKDICFICQEEKEVELVGDFPEILYCHARPYYHWCLPCRDRYLHHLQQNSNQNDDIEDPVFDDFDSWDHDDPDWEPAPVPYQPEEDWDWWMLVNENLPFPV